MGKRQSLTRQVKRGNAKVLFNPDTEQFETYSRGKRSGLFMRGAETLDAVAVDKRGEKYEARAQELKEQKEKEAIQKRARKIEQNEQS
jgi:hypothetical protein